MMRDSSVYLFLFYFFASQACARAGPGARGTRLCVKLMVAHSFLCCLMRTVLHVPAIAAREGKETPPLLNAPMALCHPYPL